MSLETVEKFQHILSQPMRRPYRKIRNLCSAGLSNSGPSLVGGARNKLKGARAKGKRFERAFAKALQKEVAARGLGELFIGQWIHFLDANGKGYAQPDQYLVTPAAVYLFETKLTQSDQAESQTMELYAPLLEAIYKRPVVSCEVFRNFRGTVPIVSGLHRLMEKRPGFWRMNWVEGDKVW